MTTTIQAIDEIISKLVELRAGLLVSANRSSVAVTMQHLFSPDGVGSSQSFREPYNPLVDGIMLGFENNAEVRLYSIQKYDNHLSPNEYRSVLRFEVDDIKASRFLTLEIKIDDDVWRTATRCQLAMAGYGTWGLRGQLVLRKIKTNSSDYKDVPITHFELGETRSAFSQHATISDGTDNDDYDIAKLIFFFEPRNFKSELHYITLGME